MRRIALVLLFVGYVSASGMALSVDADIAHQQSSDTPASSTAAREPTRSNESEGQKKATAASDDRARGRRAAHRLQLPTPRRSKPPNHSKVLQEGRKRSKSENLNRVHQSTATKPSFPPLKVANTHESLIRPVNGSVVDGRQFRVGRNAAGASAISGSAITKKNSQALNGAKATRRP
jgi:hypothetical protein